MISRRAGPPRETATVSLVATMFASLVVLAPATVAAMPLPAGPDLFQALDSSQIMFPLQQGELGEKNGTESDAQFDAVIRLQGAPLGNRGFEPTPEFTMTWGKPWITNQGPEITLGLREVTQVADFPSVSMIFSRTEPANLTTQEPVTISLALAESITSLSLTSVSHFEATYGPDEPASLFDVFVEVPPFGSDAINGRVRLTTTSIEPWSPDPVTGSGRTIFRGTADLGSSGGLCDEALNNFEFFRENPDICLGFPVYYRVTFVDVDNQDNVFTFDEPEQRTKTIFHNQSLGSFVFLEVPAPPTAVLLGLGLIVLIARRKLWRRTFQQRAYAARFTIAGSTRM